MRQDSRVGVRCVACSLIFLFLWWHPADAQAQERITFSDYDIQVTINTITGGDKGGSGISISVNGILNIPDTVRVELKSRPNVYLGYTAFNREEVLADTVLRARMKGFQVRFRATDDKFLNRITNPQNKLYLVPDGDIVFDASAVDNDGRVVERFQYVLTPQSVKEKTLLRGISITEQQREELIDARGGYQSIYYNNFDTGWRQGVSDTVRNNAYVDFSFAQPLSDIFSLGLGGLLSTEVDDEFAFLEITPFMLNSRDRTYSISGTYQSSLNGDSQRFMARASYRSIFENVIDLTRGYDRLRVKPMVSAGIGAMYFTKTPDPDLEDTVIIEPYIQFFYNIPVLDKYIIRLDFMAYTRTNGDLVLDLKNATEWQAGIDLGYDVGQSTKAVAKYSYGTFGLTNEQDQQLMVGMIVDLFN
ncbi:MAG: hypothetical protein R3281_18640 [Balneolaceae bacterium]|nr:hypothetical protein [Balneolaceae bacterium]